MRAYTNIMGAEPQGWGYEKVSAREQKKIWREPLQGFEWEVEKALHRMDPAVDFYMHENAGLGWTVH